MDKVSGGTISECPTVNKVLSIVFFEIYADLRDLTDIGIEVYAVGVANVLCNTR